ncbi:MAG: two-component system response regulator [Anaerolineaceae bacterium]|nr:two-component system response regulator [Anaerolineaceae bacterium]
MCTVLIIDDEDGFLQIIQIILKRAGFQTFVATNGHDGLAMVRDHRPDVVILDDMMPGMTGGDVCLKIKNDPLLCRTRVIMHSAGAKVHNPSYIRQIGADDVLFKPSLPSEILEKINRWF